jgi:hypothetical protein
MPAVFVLDHSALLALGSGHQRLSRIVREAHNHDDWIVYVPALCLAAAEASRVGLADHVGALPALEVVELGYAAVAAVGRLVADGVDWQFAHAVAVATPTPEWPTGRPVATGVPERYKGRGVATIALQN